MLKIPSLWTDQAAKSIKRAVYLTSCDSINPIMVSERSFHNGEELSDDLLLDRVRHSDQQAMADVFDRYGGMVYSVALRVLKDPGQAEDVMQEVFFQLWKKPDAFIEGRGSLGGWLLVLARNRAIDQVRRRKPTDSPDDVVLPANSNLASETERNLLMEKVRGVLKGLPMEQQKSLELAYFEGLSHSEIAEMTGDPLGTVKTRIRLALIGLRKAFAA
jgi:RNA polymerase sigma-70 factor, ECF subfamily